jgi:FkbM family methyltransferase
MAILRNLVTFPFFIPRICWLFNNWPQYLANYALRRRKTAEYLLRDGYRLMDSTGTLAGTIAVVFIRREYGKLQKCKTIVDIGANMGSFAIYAARSCPDARIFCYEPHPRNFEFLTQNILVNALGQRITAFQCAVAATSDQRTFGLGQSPTHSFLGAETGDFETVRCTTLTEILSSRCLGGIDFLKINCEGAEYEILESCGPNDLKRVANIRLEYHNLDGATKNGRYISQFLEGQGYKIERFTRYIEKSGLFEESGFIWASRAAT